MGQHNKAKYSDQILSFATRRNRIPGEKSSASPIDAAGRSRQLKHESPRTSRSQITREQHRRYDR
jgi:hypothetical protein